MADDVVILQLGQGPWRRTSGKVLLGSEYPHRYIGNALSNEIVLAGISHPDDVIQIARCHDLLVYRRDYFQIDTAIAPPQLLNARQKPVLGHAFGRRYSDH